MVSAQATYSEAEVWQYEPAGTLVDAEGSLLLAPYQQVQARAGTPSLGVLPSHWFITVQARACSFRHRDSHWPSSVFLEAQCRGQVQRATGPYGLRTTKRRHEENSRKRGVTSWQYS